MVYADLMITSNLAVTWSECKMFSTLTVSENRILVIHLLIRFEFEHLLGAF